mmetsp:Transcript_23740/g.51356  ORF Transcript_23740/g.51356 Transcript_23740/m.51356 type:complete len:136 (-) Transcript_23740:374-781(-)
MCRNGRNSVVYIQQTQSACYHFCDVLGLAYTRTSRLHAPLCAMHRFGSEGTQTRSSLVFPYQIHGYDGRAYTRNSNVEMLAVGKEVMHHSCDELESLPYYHLLALGEERIWFALFSHPKGRTCILFLISLSHHYY